MSAEDRERYFGGEQLPAPEQPSPPSRLERAEHSTFENWLISHSFAYRHSRTDKPTRERCGAPDFTVYKKRTEAQPLYLCGSVLAIEFKTPGNSMSTSQREWAARYGAIVHVLSSAEAAIKLVKREFGQ